MRSAGFWIVACFTFVLMAAALELNKSQPWGFIALAVLTAGYILLGGKVLGESKWYWKLGAWLRCMS